LLIAVRNALIHYRPVDKIYAGADGAIKMDAPKIIEQLRSKNVLADVPYDIGTPWLARITTPAMARWSCLSAATMVQEIAECAPRGVFKMRIEMLSPPFDVQISLSDNIGQPTENHRCVR
jgi:hypothetical protein